MKRISTILVCLFTLSIFGAAQKASDEAALRALLDDFLAGASRNDVATHEKFWADDLIYTRGAGVRIDKAELMKGVRSAPPVKPDDPKVTYTAEDVMVRLYGDTAVVAFRLVGTTTRSDGTVSISQHLNTGTFVRRSGPWRAVAWQATPIPDKSVATLASTGPTPPTAAKTTDARTYQKGPRGGCYHLNAAGKKVYVDKDKCP